MESYSDIFSLLDDFSEWKHQIILDAFQMADIVSTLLSNRESNINIIDHVRANENTNSRIMCALLSYKKHNDYPILRSFIDISLGDKFHHTVTNPRFYAEEKRIDFLVEDEDYCIIFENKIFNAVLQKNQIARYVLKEKFAGYKNEQIYIVFLPFSYESDYDMECCWRLPDEYCYNSCDGIKNDRCIARESIKSKYAQRTTITPFRDTILPWLKDSILPLFEGSGNITHGSIVQYVDYLEGLCNIRTINTQEDMELKQQLSKCLGLGDDPFANKSIVSQKLAEIDDLRQEISKLEMQCYENCFRSIQERFLVEYPNTKVSFFKNENYYRLDFPIIGLANVSLEINTKNRQVFYGILPFRHEEYEDVKNRIQRDFPQINDLVDQSSEWYTNWKNVTVEDAHESMKNIIDIITNKLNKE